MKRLILVLCLAGSLARAEVIVVDLGPNGLNAANEVPSVEVPSSGTGGAIESGLWFDTVSNKLSFVIGYGSAAGFQDLTGPVLTAHIHGPASTADSAGVQFDLGSQHFPNSNPARGGLLRGVILYETPESVEALLAGRQYLNLHTEANPPGEIRGQLLPRLNRPPSVACPSPAEHECAGPRGTELELVARVSDPEGDALTVVWWVHGTARGTNEVPATVSGSETEVRFATSYPLGSHPVEVRVSDGKLESVCTTSVTVVDRTSPLIQEIAANPKLLWPPNHKMVPVRVRVHALDCSPVTSRIVSVTSNEPVNELGDGNRAPDWEITGDLTLNLRAERSGRGLGRVYTILVETTDGINPPTRARVQVRVPHSMGQSK